MSIIAVQHNLYCLFINYSGFVEANGLQDYETYREQNCRKKNKELAKAISAIEEYKTDPSVCLNINKYC